MNRERRDHRWPPWTLWAAQLAGWRHVATLGSRVGPVGGRWNPNPTRGDPASQSFRFSRGEGGGAGSVAQELQLIMHRARFGHVTPAQPPNRRRSAKAFAVLDHSGVFSRGFEEQMEGNCSAFRCSPLTLICNAELNFSYCFEPPS